MFEITQGKGFHIKFGNGRTISVQWGVGNYCDNRDSDPTCLTTEQVHRAVGEKGSSTAEVMLSGDDIMAAGVKGYCSPAEVAVMVYWAATAAEGAELPYLMLD